MGKVQFQKGSLMVSVPPVIATYLEIAKGDKVDYKINKKTGKVEIFKDEKESE